MLVLSEAVTRELIEPGAVISIIERVARAQAADRIVWSNPPTQVLLMDSPKCRYRLKSCAIPDIPIVGIRIIGYPLGVQGEHQSTRFVLLSDPKSGAPLALVDDHWTYTLRTAASAVVGLRKLVPDRKLAVGMVGAGNLAGAVLLLLQHQGQLRQVTVTSRRAESRAQFAREWAAKLGIPVRAVETVAAAIDGSDLVVTATNAAKRIVDAAADVAGKTICTLGQHELDPVIYSSADKLVVDSWEIAKESADIRELMKAGILVRERIYAEMHELVTGAKPGRQSDRETIVFRTDGLVAQDVAINYVVYQAALERKLGVQV
jgi:alanine dehydrogenase